MSKKHLSEDEIRYIVSAETRKAQQEIHALTKETKDLKKEENARRKAMVDLESQGKKNSKAYKNLEQEVKEYSNRISEMNILQIRQKCLISLICFINIHFTCNFPRSMHI